MLSAKGLPPVDLGEDRVPRIVHLGRWCQMHLAIASRYSLLDRLHVQYEQSLQIPSRWVGASKTSFSPFCTNTPLFSTLLTPFYQRFSLCVFLFYCSVLLLLISPTVSLRVIWGRPHPYYLSPGQGVDESGPYAPPLFHPQGWRVPQKFPYHDAPGYRIIVGVPFARIPWQHGMARGTGHNVSVLKRKRRE